MTSEKTAARKAAAGERLSFEDAQSLCRSTPLLDLAEWAKAAKEKKSGKNVYYNVNRHINLTNVCTSGCPLCAFGSKAEEARAFTMSEEEVTALLRRTAARTPGLSEIHMVSALHPEKPFSYYLNMVRTVKRELPAVHLKAFTPVEIVHFAKLEKKSVEEILQILKFAGLDSLPGGGAEILDDAVRQIICPNKATTAEWIATIHSAHKLNIPTNATMLYGHVETEEQRLRHLFTLRDIQDKTGGFQAFVAFPFHPANTALAHLRRVSSWEDLKWIALARLILDNIDHVKAFWMMLTLPIAQLSLAFGADDLDGTVEEEKIIHAAGAATQTGITQQKIRQLVEETGYVPIERDTFYRPVGKI